RENVMNNSTRSMLLRLDKVPEALGGAEKAMAGIYASFSGELKGSVLMLFPEESVKTLFRLLGNCELEKHSLDEYQDSLLSEVGNICLCWYLSAISKMIDVEIMPCVPVAAYDMAGAVIDLALIRMGMVSDRALLVLTDFKGEINEIHGAFLMMLEPESQKLLAQRLGVA
ncbi:MAG: chemotaxis protein CheC, partial [Thermoplasmata archaeon]|nr:chemotaxis protein CheC [Thermoplasmata archaeon]